MHQLKRHILARLHGINKVTSLSGAQICRQCSGSSTRSENDRDTSFGFQTVKESEKSGKGTRNTQPNIQTL